MVAPVPGSPRHLQEKGGVPAHLRSIEKLTGLIVLLPCCARGLPPQWKAAESSGQFDSCVSCAAAVSAGGLGLAGPPRAAPRLASPEAGLTTEGFMAAVPAGPGGLGLAGPPEISRAAKASPEAGLATEGFMATVATWPLSWPFPTELTVLKRSRCEDNHRMCWPSDPSRVPQSSKPAANNFQCIAPQAAYKHGTSASEQTLSNTTVTCANKRLPINKSPDKCHAGILRAWGQLHLCLMASFEKDIFALLGLIGAKILGASQTEAPTKPYVCQGRLA